MSTPAEELLTIPELAAQLEEPQHRVAYAVRTRGIEPVARLAGVRFFDQDSIETVRTALDQIKGRR